MLGFGTECNSALRQSQIPYRLCMGFLPFCYLIPIHPVEPEGLRSVVDSGSWVQGTEQVSLVHLPTMLFPAQSRCYMASLHFSKTMFTIPEEKEKPSEMLFRRNHWWILRTLNKRSYRFPTGKWFELMESATYWFQGNRWKVLKGSEIPAQNHPTVMDISITVNCHPL